MDTICGCRCVQHDGVCEGFEQWAHGRFDCAVISSVVLLVDTEVPVTEGTLLPLRLDVCSSLVLVLVIRVLKR